MDEMGDNRVASLPMGCHVPRVIHQIYINNGPDLTVPKTIQDNIADIKSVNPGWEHRLYGEPEIAAYISRNYDPDILRAYHRIHPKYAAARADFFRYLLIYSEGGVYLDLKSTTRRPLDEVIGEEDQYILVRWKDDSSNGAANWGRHAILDEIGEQEYQQWHILAVAGHPFLRSVILKVLDNIANYDPLNDLVGKPGVLRLTGPIAYTLAIAPLVSSSNCKRIIGHEQLGLVYSIFAEVGA